MRKTAQISESLGLGIILAMAGGFMDAYSYVCREHVFANAQTGNILLIGVKLSEMQWMQALRYAFPVVAFTVGIAVSDIIRYLLKEKPGRIHWRQITLLFEVAVMAAVAFIPVRYNLFANSLLSLACGIQVESFRKINGNGIATTMCIGNLRTATQALVDYWHTKDCQAMQKGLLFYGIILFFVAGAVIGNQCVRLFGIHAVLADALLLLAGFVLMFIDREKGEIKVDSL